MPKIAINNNLKLEKLRRIKLCVHKLVSLEIEKKYLSEQLPAKYKEAKMRYKTTTSYHINQKKEKIKYQNTSAYILLNNSKVKTTSKEDIKIQLILERIFEIDTKCNYLQKICKLYCHSINSMKCPEEITWNLEILKSTSEREIFAAKEHTYIFEKAQQFVTGKINPKNAPELSNTNYNYYIGFENEIYRSKNEVISAMCLRYCGLSYCIEPAYPNCGLRADFGIYCSFYKNKQGKTIVLKKPRQIFLEIAGISNNEKYETTLSKKAEIAKSHNIPLLIIDSGRTASLKSSANSDVLPNITDSCSENEISAHSVFDFDYLCNVFTELYFGQQNPCGEKLVPYKVTN